MDLRRARFEAVREAFVANFDDGEIGAACSIVVDGHPVVDLGRLGGRGSVAAVARVDTLVNVYSVG